MPIVIAVSYGLVLGRVATGTPTFFVLAAILLPVTPTVRARCRANVSSTEHRLVDG
jgi:hypothetical protein